MFSCFATVSHGRFELCRCALQVEDPKKVLLLYGNKTSQVVKDVLADIGKLKAVRLAASPAVSSLAASRHHAALSKRSWDALVTAVSRYGGSNAGYVWISPDTQGLFEPH